MDNCHLFKMYAFFLHNFAAFLKKIDRMDYLCSKAVYYQFRFGKNLPH